MGQHRPEHPSCIRMGRSFFCHGYNINGVMLQLSDDLKSVSVVWRTDVLDTHHGGYVEVNGTIYGSNWINNNQRELVRNRLEYGC